MEKKLLAAFLLFMFIAPVYAESSHEICAEEANEAGIGDREEINIYISECMSQMATDAEPDRDAPEPENDQKE